MANSPNSERLYWVDWIRALAAYAVLITHAHAVTWEFWSLLPLDSKTPSFALVYVSARFGFDAVIIFFVLSGYLVGGKLMQKMAAGTLDMKRYAVDRFARVYVPFVPALVLSACVALALHKPISTGGLAVNLFQMQGILGPVFADNGPLWTLSYEFWFYVVAGFIAILWSATQALRPLILLMAVATLSIFCVLQPIFFMCWLIGALAYHLGPSLRPRRDLCLGALLLSIGLVARQFSVYQRYDNPSPSTQFALLLICAGLGLTLSVIAYLKPSSSLSKFERLGSFCAASSYTLYLTHAPVLSLLTAGEPSKFNQFTLTNLIGYGWRLLVCLVVAIALYWLFERRTSDFKNWIYLRITEKAPQQKL